MWISKPVVSCIEEEVMLLLVFYYCIWDFRCCCRRFNPSLCCLSPFPLSYVAVSRPCRLCEFYPNRALILHGHAEIWNVSSRVEKYFTSEPSEQVSYKYFSTRDEKLFFIFSSVHVLFYLLYIHQWNTKLLHFNIILLRKAQFIF